MLNAAALRIVKTSFDKAESKFRWFAQASSTEMDLDDQNTTEELFDNFVKHIVEQIAPPDQFKIQKWNGGLPYLSISHFSSDAAVAGYAERIYRDGKYLKASGYFTNDPIGVAAYQAVSKSLLPGENPIRISISWLDWVHTHNANGQRFDRRTEKTACPYCKEIGQKNISFNDGLIIHLALTRIPANPQTFIVESEEKMDKTFKDVQRSDAASIVGEELAETMADAEMSKTHIPDVMITKSEDDPISEGEPEVKAEVEAEPVAEDKAKADKKPADEEMDDSESDQEDTEEEDPEEDELDKILSNIKTLATEAVGTREEHIATVNAAYETLAGKMQERITAMFNPVPEQKTTDPAQIDVEKLKADISQSILDQLMPTLSELSLKIEKLGDVNTAANLKMPEPVAVDEKSPMPISKQRNSPLLQQVSTEPEPQFPVIRRIANRSVGLPIQA